MAFVFFGSYLFPNVYQQFFNHKQLFVLHIIVNPVVDKYQLAVNNQCRQLPFLSIESSLVTSLVAEVGLWLAIIRANLKLYFMLRLFNN